MTVTRITGMASGLDVDSIVKKLMTAEKAPLDKLNQKKQLLEWKREGYREVSTKLVSFLNDKLSALSLSSAVNAQKTTITGNTTAVSAKATGAANGGVLNISVGNLATSTQVVSSSAAVDSDGRAYSSSTTMGTLMGTDSTSDPQTVSIQVGSGSAVSISFSSSDTISTFVSKINSSSAGVTAVFDSGKLSLTNKTTGASAITVTGDAFTKLNVLSSDSSNIGKNANLTVNGISMTQSSNEFTLNGIVVSLNSETPSGESSQIVVSADTDALVDNVQSFVDAYNEVLSLLNTKVDEATYSKYPPLTDDQKEDMTDDEITLWEAKAKSGMLKNDSILEETLSKMRTAMIQGVKQSDGTTISFAQLGISTGTYETKGKLLLDKDKLKTALSNDASIVKNFFGATDSSTATSNTYTDSDGIFARMKKISKSTLESLASKAGTSKVSSDTSAAFLVNSIMGTELTELERRIEEMEDRLNTIETNYYKKFTAMETAINNYNSQASALSGM